MNKKVLIALLMTGVAFTNAQAKEPTIKETITFIQKVLKNDDVVTYKMWRKGSSTMAFLLRAKISFNNECKPFIKQYNKTGSGNTWTQTAKIDLSKHTIDYDFVANKYSYDLLYIADRQGIKSISRGAKRRGKTDYTNSSSVRFEIDAQGVYREKLKKAFKHLSNKCYEKYGTKNNEPF